MSKVFSPRHAHTVCSQQARDIDPMLAAVMVGPLLTTHQYSTIGQSSKHGSFTQCCFNVGPASKTVGQHWNSIGSMPRVCWEWLVFAELSRTSFWQLLQPSMLVEGRFNVVDGGPTLYHHIFSAPWFPFNHFIIVVNILLLPWHVAGRPDSLTEEGVARAVTPAILSAVSTYNDFF